MTWMRVAVCSWKAFCPSTLTRGETRTSHSTPRTSKNSISIRWKTQDLFWICSWVCVLSNTFSVCVCFFFFVDVGLGKSNKSRHQKFSFCTKWWEVFWKSCCSNLARYRWEHINTVMFLHTPAPVTLKLAKNLILTLVKQDLSVALVTLLFLCWRLSWILVTYQYE